MFNFDEDPMPRRWADMALDYKLVFGLHGVAMVLFVTGGLLNVPLELAIIAVAVSAAAAAAVVVRLRTGWRWSGEKPKDWLLALISPLAAVIMVFVASNEMSSATKIFLPWGFAAANIGLFWMLYRLHILRASKKAFDADCRGEKLEPPGRPAEPDWVRIVRVVYSVAFVAVWLEFMAFFYFDTSGLRSGSATMTATKTWALSDHGAIVYVSAAQGATIQWLGTIAFVCMPIAILSGFFLHYVLGVRLFNAPSGNRPAWLARITRTST